MTNAPAPAMSKNLIFGILGLIVLLIIIGSIVLRIVKPEAEATLISGATQMLTLLITAAGIIYGLGKADAKIDTVVRQTNGMNTAKEEENQRLTNIIIAAGLSPALSTKEIEIIAQPRAPGDHASPAPIQ